MEVNETLENDILGFDPAQLNCYQQDSETKNLGDSNIYHPKPALSKSEDGVYRSQIKVIYNPYSLKDSILEQQAYSLQDANGSFFVVSSLTNNDKNCPIFKAWKQCHYSTDEKMKKQAEPEAKGGLSLFDKRFARYVLIQVIEDNNQPELVGRYMFWKMPKAIWEIINAKMSPSPESKKAKIPVMDFLFGRAIDLEVTPGPDDPAHPERKTRETSYSTSELTDDVVSCTNPDGSPLLDSSEQDILDKYVDEMTKRVWKEKNPATREVAIAEINAEENTKQLRTMYRDIVDKIKSFAPNLVEELGYKGWSDEVKSRVNAWINIVLSGHDPRNFISEPKTTNAGDGNSENAGASPVTPEISSSDSDLPF